MNDFDRAQLSAPLAIDQGESSWLCAEAAGQGPRGPRNIAVLAWLHRTGPRLLGFDAGIGLLDHAHLPARWRDLIPSWLPIVTPVKIRTDDRPLLMVVAYDLDKPDLTPIQIEREIEHVAFDLETFAGTTVDGTIAFRVTGGTIELQVASESLSCRIWARQTKPVVEFGDRSPLLRHGDIEIGYRQRSRMSVAGHMTLRGESIRALAGEGAHDRHWRWSTVMNLSWLWLHLRLQNHRELVAYVIRDSRDPTVELGRGAWLVHADAAVERIPDLELVAGGGCVRVTAASLDLRCALVHAVERPHLHMRAFGDGIVGGIAEAPVRIIEHRGELPIGGWLETFDAAECRPA